MSNYDMLSNLPLSFNEPLMFVIKTCTITFQCNDNSYTVKGEGNITNY